MLKNQAESEQKLNITILCKVVDNFGDIGFVYRLARAISDLSPDSRIRIVADNLKSFSLLSPEIDPLKDEQTANGWKIFNWNAEKTCIEHFRKNPPEIILECFQCGRPEWLENLLFTEKIPNIAHIIMIDYLTAEPYAETFHKLKSLTRSARVQKVNFMPGFTNKTGGLVLDKPFVSALKEQNKQKASNIENRNEPFNVLFFGYPRDYSPAINALQNFGRTSRIKLNVLLAKGAGFESFCSAYKNAERNEKDLFALEELPFLSQIEWDALLAKTPLLFIRGEDSLSRACLCGVPFVWHAYPQSEEYQLVKVNALLDRMSVHFSAGNFETVKKCWRLYNTPGASPKDVENALDDFLQSYGKLCGGFKDFSNSLLENGDLAEHLLEFIKTRAESIL